MWYFFEGKLADETDVFFYLFPLILHLPNIILTPLVLQSFEHILVLLNYLHQLLLSIRFVQCFLFILTQILIHSSIRCLAAYFRIKCTFRLDVFYLLHQSTILTIYLHVTHLLQGYLLRSLL